MFRSHLVIIITLLLMIMPVAAQITAEVGETWIRFEWPATSGMTLVADGVDQGTADLGIYYLSHLNPDEEHQIQLINTTSGVVADSAKVRTLAPLTTSLFFIAVEVILTVICLLMQDPVRVIMTGTLGSTLGFLLFSLTLGHGSLWMVVFGLVGFQAIFVILALYNLLEDALRWW